MRNLLLASALILAQPALAIDFSVSSPTEATLITGAPAAIRVPAATDPQTGLTVPAHINPQMQLPDKTEWVYTRWGLWWKPTGQSTTDAMGNTVPVLANDGRFYALGRWNGDPANLPFNITNGWTVSKDAQTGVTTYTKSTVIITSPPVAGFPVGY